MPFLDRLRASDFLRHNAIYFFGSLLIGALNYLYYPVLGRLLEPASFGEVQTLVSLFLQIGIFLSVLGLVSINVIANTDNIQQRNRVILELEKLALIISAVLLLASVAFGPWLQAYFKFESPLPFSLLALAVVVTVPFTFRTAYLRGKKQFGHNSLAFILGAGSKLLLSVALVAVGLSTAGALFGIVLAQLLAFTYAARYARRHGFTESLRGKLWRVPDMRLIKPELKYALLVLGGSLAVTVLYSVDIVVVKHYFDVQTAGLYAGIATVARILFFLTASIAQVLMPSVRLRQSAAENRRILLKSLFILVTIGGGTLAVFWAAPSFIIGILMGSTYQTYAYLLPRLSLAIFVISILNLVATYYMALRYYPAGIVMVAGTAITYVWMQHSHHSLQAVVDSLLYGSLTILVLLSLWLVWARRSVLKVGALS